MCLGSSKIKIIALLICVVTLQANEYDQWLASKQNEYFSYKKNFDQEFEKVLETEWKEFKSFYDPSPYKEDKPKKLPSVLKELEFPKDKLSLSPRVKKVTLYPKPKKYVKAEAGLLKTFVKPKDVQAIKFSFYNQDIKLYYDHKLFDLSTISSKSISEFWKYNLQTDWKSVVKQIKNYSDVFKFNGWAKYQFIHAIAKQVYSDNNRANLFTWFYLTKLGYDTKVAYGKNNVYLLATVSNSLYQVSFYKINNKKYYILDPSGKAKSKGQVYTYKGEYANSIDTLSFVIDEGFFLNSNLKESSLSFKYSGKNYKVNASYSGDLIDFYKSYPQVDFKVYFESSKSYSFAQSLLNSLQKHIAEMSELEATNFLLRFCQKAFKYKTDQEQFGYEKPLFPEETFFYAYSDCEDRTILFRYLVEKLLNLEVVGVKYNGHLAAAVVFNTKVDGDYFKYRNKTFVISDPTYINANVGMTMRQYKNSKFDILR